MESVTFPADVHPCDENLEPVARIQLRCDATITSQAEADLMPHLSTRVTNREAGSRVPFPAAAEHQLQTIAAQYDCELKLISEEQPLMELGQIIGEGDRLRFLCPELHQALMAEVRWSKAEAEATGDGIDLATLELTSIQQVIMNVLKRPEVAGLLRAQNAGTRLCELGAKAVRAASVMGLLSLNGHSAEDKLRGGQAMQHLWLTANSLGWAWYPMTALIYMFGESTSPVNALFNEQERASLASLSNRFDRIFPASSTQTRLMLFRLTQAAPPSARSLRLPLTTVLKHASRKKCSGCWKA